MPPLYILAGSIQILDGSIVSYRPINPIQSFNGAGSKYWKKKMEIQKFRKNVRDRLHRQPIKKTACDWL